MKLKYAYKKTVHMFVALSIGVSHSTCYSTSDTISKKQIRSHLAPLTIGYLGSKTRLPISQRDPNHPLYRSYYYEDLNISEGIHSPAKKLIVKAVEVHLNQVQGDTWGDFWNEVLKDSPAAIEVQAEKVVLDGVLDIQKSQLSINAFEVSLKASGHIKSVNQPHIRSLSITKEKTNNLLGHLKDSITNRDLNKLAIGSKKISDVSASQTDVGTIPKTVEHQEGTDTKLTLATNLMKNILYQEIDYIRSLYILEDYPTAQLEITATLPKARELTKRTGLNSAELELVSMQSRLNGNLNYFGHRAVEVPFYTPAFQFQQLENQIDHYIESIEYMTALEFQKDLANYHSEFLRKTIDESQLYAEKSFDDLRRAQIEVQPIEHQFAVLSSESELLNDLMKRDLQYFLQVARERKFTANEERKRLAAQNRLIALAVKGAALYLLGPVGMASAQSLMDRLKNPPKFDDDPEVQIAWLEGLTDDYNSVTNNFYSKKSKLDSEKDFDSTDILTQIQNMKKNFETLKGQATENLKKAWSDIRDESKKMMDRDGRSEVKIHLSTLGEARKKLKELKTELADKTQELSAKLKENLGTNTEDELNKSNEDLVKEDPEMAKYFEEVRNSDKVYKNLVIRLDKTKNRLADLKSTIDGYHSKMAILEATMETATLTVSLSSGSLLETTISRKDNLTFAISSMKRRAEDQILTTYYELIHGLRYLLLGRGSAAFAHLMTLPVYQRQIDEELQSKRAQCAKSEVKEIEICKKQLQEALEDVKQNYKSQLGNLKDTILDLVTKMEHSGVGLVPNTGTIGMALTLQQVDALNHRHQIEIELDQRFYQGSCKPKHRLIINNVGITPQSFKNIQGCAPQSVESIQFELELNRQGTMIDEFGKNWIFDYSNLGPLNFWRGLVTFTSPNATEFIYNQSQVPGREQTIDLINAVIGKGSFANNKSANLFNQHAGYTKATLRIKNDGCRHLDALLLTVNYTYYAESTSEIICKGEIGNVSNLEN